MVCNGTFYCDYLYNVGDKTLSMQIKSIVLYNNQGEKRVLEFQLGAVNIITGESRTGKSTIIDIVDFCMGRSSFNIPDGPIRQSVSFYAVLFSLDEIELFIAKPRPVGNGQSSNAVYYKIGRNLTIPDIEEIEPFSTDADLVEILSRRLGIYPNEAGQDFEDRNFEVNANHTKFYLFQPEDYIKNKHALFYRQIEEGLSKHIRTTLPFILGAIEDESLRLGIELREKQRELAKAKRALSEAEESTIDRANRAQALLNEAVQVGIVDKLRIPNDVTSAVSMISEIITNWQPDAVPIIEVDGRIQPLRQQEIEIQQSIYEKQEQIQATQAYVASATGYENEARQQVVRLISIGLFDEDDQHICPVCSSHLDKPVVSAMAIHNQLGKLATELNLVGREKPRLDQYIDELNVEFEQLREQRKQIQYNIRSVIDEAEAAERISDDRIRIARVIGRMSWFLETSPLPINEITEIKKLVERIQREVDQLTDRLDLLSVESHLNTILDNINLEMTDLARKLQLEHQYPYKLNPNNLTVSISVPGAPIIMGKNLGSGSNYLGVHLITFLALQKYFIEQLRPVPNFVIFDQPSQVYFPAEAYTDSDGNTQQPEDLQAIERMFNLFFEYCRSLHPNLQIIVLEHAMLDNDDFNNALVEKPWRDGRALIPPHWIE